MHRAKFDVADGREDVPVDVSAKAYTSPAYHFIGNGGGAPLFGMKAYSVPWITSTSIGVSS